MPGADALALLGGCRRTHFVAELHAFRACQQAEAGKLVVDRLRRIQPVAILIHVAGPVLVAQAILVAVHIGPILVPKSIAILIADVAGRTQAVARAVEIAARRWRGRRIRTCARSVLGVGCPREHTEQGRSGG